jgi:hypothetical protein
LKETLQPSACTFSRAPLPLPPMLTQFHPRSPNPRAPDTRGFSRGGVEGTQELAEGRNPKKTKRNGIPVADFALPNTKYQQPSTC